jgi:hypothetical protein
MDASAGRENLLPSLHKRSRRAGRNSHTHIRVTGKVVLVKHEADGDLHIRLSDGKRWIVAECIPKLPCAEPKVGQTITVEGISRFDEKHKFPEVHPVEGWK